MFGSFAVYLINITQCLFFLEPDPDSKKKKRKQLFFFSFLWKLVKLLVSVSCFHCGGLVEKFIKAGR